MSPIIFATKNNNVEAVEWIKQRQDVNIEECLNSDGQNPMEMAEQMGHSLLVEAMKKSEQMVKNSNDGEMK